VLQVRSRVTFGTSNSIEWNSSDWSIVHNWNARSFLVIGNL